VTQKGQQNALVTKQVQKISRISNELKAKSVELEELKAAKNSNMQSISQLRTQIQNLGTQLATAQTNAKQAKNSSSAKNIQLQELGTLKTQVKNLQQKLSTSEAAKQTLTAQMQTINQQLAQLTAASQQSAQEKTAIESRKMELENQIAQLEQKISAKNSEIESIRQGKNKETRNAMQLRQEVDILIQTKNQFARDISNLKEQLRSSEALQKSLQNAKSGLEAQQANYQQKTQRIKELETQLAQASSSNKSAQLQPTINRLTANLQKQATNKAAINANNLRLTQEIDTLRQSQSNVTAINQKLQQFQNQLAEKENQLLSKNANQARLMSQIEALKAEITTLKGQQKIENQIINVQSQAISTAVSAAPIIAAEETQQSLSKLTARDLASLSYRGMSASPRKEIKNTLMNRLDNYFSSLATANVLRSEYSRLLKEFENAGDANMTSEAREALNKSFMKRLEKIVNIPIKNHLKTIKFLEKQSKQNPSNKRISDLLAKYKKANDQFIKPVNRDTIKKEYKTLLEQYFPKPSEEIRNILSKRYPKDKVNRVIYNALTNPANKRDIKTGKYSRSGKNVVNNKLMKKYE